VFLGLGEMLQLDVAKMSTVLHVFKILHRLPSHPPDPYGFGEKTLVF